HVALNVGDHALGDADDVVEELEPRRFDLEEIAEILDGRDDRGDDLAETVPGDQRDLCGLDVRVDRGDGWPQCEDGDAKSDFGCDLVLLLQRQGRVGDLLDGKRPVVVGGVGNGDGVAGLEAVGNPAPARSHDRVATGDLHDLDPGGHDL